MTRAYLDTNLYISYLLNPLGESPPTRIVRAGITNVFTILFGNPTLHELLTKVVSKPYLSSRIGKQDVEDLLELLYESAEHVAHVPDVIPAVSRDRKDDYLLTYARMNHADYLVTGDKDLLVLKRVDDVLIVTPAEFVFMLEHEQQ